MKTTIDLPVEIVRGLKLQAAQKAGKLNDTTLDCLALSLRSSSPTQRAQKRFRIKLPIIPAPVGSRPFELTAQRLHDLEAESDIESYEASLRR